MAFQYDPEGRLSSASQPGAPGNGGTYAYDAFGLLASRTVNQSGSASTTTLYVYDLAGHVIAETDSSGATQREYIWMDDLPVAVVAGVNTSTPTLYYVHADHLGRPARMTAQNWSWVWDVIYSPFGATSYIWNSPSATMDLRFPGQWFQLENGLAYNWHRHYDPTIGRYIQPDPLGLEALLSDGPSAYNYVGENPLVYIDETGEFLWLPAIAVVATAILWPEPANAPRQKDPIFPNNPLEPYIVGAAAGFCEFAWTGREIKFSSNFRVAPFGNRTGHLQGRWPHYHRRGTNEGQGIGRHRPWETKSVDQSFWDRF